MTASSSHSAAQASGFRLWGSVKDGDRSCSTELLDFSGTEWKESRYGLSSGEGNMNKFKGLFKAGFGLRGALGKTGTLWLVPLAWASL